MLCQKKCAAATCWNAEILNFDGFVTAPFVITVLRSDETLMDSLHVVTYVKTP